MYDSIRNSRIDLGSAVRNAVIMAERDEASDDLCEALDALEVAMQRNDLDDIDEAHYAVERAFAACEPPSGPVENMTLERSDAHRRGHVDYL